MLRPGYKTQGETQSRDSANLHVFMRGVMWRSTELNSARVWQQISQSWAVPFYPQLMSQSPNPGGDTTPDATVTSHKGVTDMAHELYAVIEPYLTAHQGVPLLALAP